MFDAKSAHALGLIYDAAANLGGWRRALDATAEAVGARAGALAIRNPERKSGETLLMSTPYLAFSRSASGLIYALRHRHLQRGDWNYLAEQEAHRPVADLETGATAEELDARGDYRALRAKLGVSRRLGVRLNGDRMWFDGLSLAFDAALPALPQSANARLAPLLPHLTRSVELGRMFSALRTRYRAALAALDHVEIALAVVLPDGAILLANSEMERVLDAQDGVRRRNGALRADGGALDAALRAALASAARAAAGEEGRAETAIAVDRPSGARGYLVDIAPLGDGHGELEKGLDAALVAIIDPERAPKVKLDRFAASYGFTPAEADICRLMLAGAAAEDIAEQRNASPVTVKNQIASLLAKAEARNRAELIRLLARVTPPIA